MPLPRNTPRSLSGPNRTLGLRFFSPQEMAKLTTQELAELEKARFGRKTGEVPEWGLPGPGGKGISRLFPSSMYTLDDAA